MIRAKAQLESVSPYSQSQHYETPKLDRELARDYEARTWRGRIHSNSDGYVIIPNTAFKNSLAEAAKYMGEQIPGKAKNTYTKHFEAGVLVVEPLTLPIKASDVHGEWLFVPSDGKRGGGKRVSKCFPRIDSWAGEVEFIIVDEIITEDVFRRTLEAAGSFIGIGRFRPRNNGFYGRFAVKSLSWVK